LWGLGLKIWRAEEQVGLGSVGLWGLGLKIWRAEEQVGLGSVGSAGFRIWSFGSCRAGRFGVCGVSCS
jgi:hypothetical protein